MAEKMTLERHAEKIRRIAEHMAKDGFGGWADSCVQAADAIDAHLTQPSQAADVDAVREVIADLESAETMADSKNESEWLFTLSDKLTRAIGNAQAEE